MQSSYSHDVATCEEDAPAIYPGENSATSNIAADESVAAANPLDDIASPAVPPTENIASEYSKSSHSEDVIDMESDMPPIVDLATAGLRRSP
jgi:hypothetical protein